MSLSAEDRARLRVLVDEHRRTAAGVGAATVTTPSGIQRRCFGCHRYLPLDAFCRAPKKPLGHSYQCKNCKAAYKRAHRRQQRDNA